ncbi:MAG: cell division protein FtsZ [Pseudomonadota bacterium]|nr:cell division protein FtsZ [Pseudomonadota bacterium]
MSINLSLPTDSIGSELKPRITVIGVGGAGGNAVNNMIQSGLEGVEFLVANSDAQALAHSKSENRIQMGINITQGLGAGANPEIGQAAAEETLEEIISHIKDTNMIFITAGLGGGTGTGAAPVIARAAREHGILTVGVVTKPFQFEGVNRMKMAEAGLEELQQYVDTLLIIPNQNLFRVANEKTTFADAFKMADDVLYSGVRGVTDLMVMPGLINLDFADIKSVMSEMGKAMMGTGEAEGEKRATEAAEQAIANPLLDDTSMSGAKGVLINITAGTDITLFEVDEAANRIRDEVDGDVNIIFGSTFDETLEGSVRVSVVATGINSNSAIKSEPTMRPVAEVLPQKIQSTKNSQESGETIELKRQNGAILKEEKSKLEDPLVDEIEAKSVNEAILHEKVQMKPAQAEGPIREETLLEDDEIPAFLSEKKVDEDVFIPAEPSNGSASTTPADPFAAADMLNAKKETEIVEAPRKSSAMNLFERVTGVARGNKRRMDDNLKQETSVSQTQNTAEDGPKEDKESVPDKVDIKDIATNAHQEAGLKQKIAVDLQNDSKAELDSVNEEPPNLNTKIVIETVNESSSESNEDRIEVNAEEEANSQILLGDLDPADRLDRGKNIDDPLDIPAFLRRQAN